MIYPIVTAEHYHVFEELNIIVVALKLLDGSVVVGSHEISSTNENQEHTLAEAAAYYDAISKIKETPVVEEVGDKFGPFTNVSEIEDAVLISQSTANKLQTTEIRDVHIFINKDYYPPNVYDYEYIPVSLSDMG